MPPKKATASKFLVRATGQGEWSQDNVSQGQFRVVVNTDMAHMQLHAGPDYLDEWNPIPLKSYSLKYLRGGSHLRIFFETARLDWKGELELNVFGGFAGKFSSPAGDAKVQGAGDVEEARDHVQEVPRPSQDLARKMREEQPPRGVKWEAPACIRDGVVTFVGIGGPSKAGKTLLAKALVAKLKEKGREVAVVEQSRYDRTCGSYNCSAGVHEMFSDNPWGVNWPDLTKAITKAAEKVAPSGTVEVPSFVILEGFLSLWMPQIVQPMHHRIFLRASRIETERRRQASSTLAEPYIEHVFWPCHLEFQQAQGPWDDIRIDDDEQGYPIPESVVSEAWGILKFDAPADAEGVALEQPLEASGDEAVGADDGPPAA